MQTALEDSHVWTTRIVTKKTNVSVTVLTTTIAASVCQVSIHFAGFYNISSKKDRIFRDTISVRIVALRFTTSIIKL